jgi:hypothetical protein
MAVRCARLQEIVITQRDDHRRRQRVACQTPGWCPGEPGVSAARTAPRPRPAWPARRLRAVRRENALPYLSAGTRLPRGPDPSRQRRTSGGRLAQRESASFTPRRSLVRSQYRPPGQSYADLSKDHSWGRRGWGEDSICFDHSGECRDPEAHRHGPGRWRGVVSLKAGPDPGRGEQVRAIRIRASAEILGKHVSARKGSSMMSTPVGRPSKPWSTSSCLISRTAAAIRPTSGAMAPRRSRVPAFQFSGTSQEHRLAATRQ